MPTCIDDRPRAGERKDSTLINLNVPYLSKETIEAHALALLEEFPRSQYPIEGPPIPVDDLAEKLLGLTIDFSDLRDRFQANDVLGALFAKDSSIYIDERLDPDEYPDQEGRYRFTVAHEIGHWCQHRPYLGDLSVQIEMFSDESLPSVVCRESENRTIVEYQANYFAAALLMPKPLVYSTWRETRGTTRPLHFDQEGDAAFGQVAGEMARSFKVSRQAMKIRLDELGLFKTAPELGPAAFWEGA